MSSLTLGLYAHWRKPGAANSLQALYECLQRVGIKTLFEENSAELIGLKGIYVDRPEDLGAAWDEALAADRPVVLEVKTDPEVPPLPPHITFDEARHLTSTLLHGDPRESGVIKGTAKQVLASIIPGK